MFPPALLNQNFWGWAKEAAFLTSTLVHSDTCSSLTATVPDDPLSRAHPQWMVAKPLTLSESASACNFHGVTIIPFQCTTDPGPST